MKNNKQDPRNALKQTLVSISLAKRAKTFSMFSKTRRICGNSKIHAVKLK